MNNQGYLPKEIYFDHSGREKLQKGIETISRAVKSTLGPLGNTVLIESPHLTSSITVTKDGVTVAKSIDLVDPVENLAVKMMKEAAIKTATQAGDGTTTAIVLAESIVRSGMEHIDPSYNKTEVLRHIQRITNEIVERLKNSAKKLTKKTLVDVATISANNDKELGKIIADAYHRVGKGGMVAVEKSQTTATYSEITQGIKINRGYASNLFVNNQKKDECILEDVLILVTDQEIGSILAIENILKPIIQANKKLLIIGSCTANVINTLAANVVKNNLKLCNIPPPSFGYRQNELMQDIALSVGAKYFSEKTGDNLELINMADLGHAEKIVVGREQTVIIKNPQHTNEDLIQERIKELQEAADNTNKKSDKDFILERIAGLSGAVGVIYVGGDSDIEQKEKFDRVDDSVCAVRSALEEGILPGGGIALWQVNDEYTFEHALTDKKDESWLALSIMINALKAPLYQILDNAGIEAGPIVGAPQFSWDNYGYDVKNNKHGDMYELGIIDPLKVTKHALKNAVSVATTILSTNAIVTMARSLDKNG
ncbi:MAG: putative 60 kDa chaperonin [Prokaryotic dsDNA virus sp.]|nr:MAG: putative 60 kDa chaperonin [Prokaryotic dsDNA virus sp.]|tara:strand:+ start:13857 stop:15482 length:1626 start_codon:yes stop_codon:yes gene_type:complete